MRNGIDIFRPLHRDQKVQEPHLENNEAGAKQTQRKREIYTNELAVLRALSVTSRSVFKGYLPKVVIY